MLKLARQFSRKRNTSMPRSSGRITMAKPLVRDDRGFLYRDMFENAVSGMFQTTIDGRYLAANVALARIYGYGSRAEMLADLTSVRDQLYVDPNRRDEFVRHMAVDSSVVGFESQVYRRDRSIIWISETCRAVHSQSGALLHYEGTVEEITERKSVEHDLRRLKEQADAANRAKSVFLANMSHEFRTPLNAILGFGEVLKDELFGPLGNSRYKTYATDIYDSGVHLLNIIKALLDLARIEAGHAEINKEPVEVAFILKNCERLIRKDAERHQVNFKTIYPEEPAVVAADPTRLQQILINLLSNAVKFTPSGNQVTVQAGTRADGTVLFEVVDTGIGMTSAEVERAMQPFEQIDSSLSRPHQGTGLGLTLAKALAQLHGGSLELHSSPGNGTRAVVTIPYSDAA